jgi:hypothetical protein
LNTTAFTIYDASAGSGKTYTLTKEYLKILFLATNDDAYRKILAITFNNKAVEEMKSRKTNRKPSLRISFTIMRPLIFLRLINSHTKSLERLHKI